MNIARAALASAAIALLSGCFGGARAPSELLTLTAASNRAVGETRSAGQGETVTVLAPEVPRASATTRIPVYVSPTVVQYLTNATYVEQPSALFRTLLSETIAARTGRTVLDPAQYSQVQGAVVSGQLLQFGVDPTQMQAVVLFEASVTRAGASASSRRFEARVPIADVQTATVAPALNQASNQVAEQVADWIGR